MYNKSGRAYKCGRGYWGKPVFSFTFLLSFLVGELLCHGLEVRDALFERVVLLLRRDGLLHVGHDPVDHVPLLHAPHHVRQLQLVVETLLNLKPNEKRTSSQELETSSYTAFVSITQTIRLPASKRETTPKEHTLRGRAETSNFASAPINRSGAHT